MPKFCRTIQNLKPILRLTLQKIEHGSKKKTPGHAMDLDNATDIFVFSVFKRFD